MLDCARHVAVCWHGRVAAYHSSTVPCCCKLKACSAKSRQQLLTEAPVADVSSLASIVPLGEGQASSSTDLHSTAADERLMSCAKRCLAKHLETLQITGSVPCHLSQHLPPHVAPCGTTYIHCCIVCGEAYPGCPHCCCLLAAAVHLAGS